MTKGTTKSRKNKKPAPALEPTFLLKRGDDFYLLPLKMLDTFSLEDIYRLGVVTYVEQRRQLLKDALCGDHYVNDIKVVDGLENSLRKLDEKFPKLIAQLNQIYSNNVYSKIGRC